MRKLRISEISAVDYPSVRPARAVIMKCATQEHPIMQFRKIGGESVASFSTLDEAMLHLRKAHGMDPLQAMEQAAQMHPDLVESYNDVGDAVAKSIAEANTPKPIARAVTDFEKCITAIQVRDRCTRLGALIKARTEYPDAFAAYQEA